MTKSRIFGYKVVKPTRPDLNKFFGSLTKAEKHASAYSRSQMRVSFADAKCYIVRCRDDGTEDRV